MTNLSSRILTLLSLNLFINCCKPVLKIIGCFISYCSPWDSTWGPVAGLESAHWKATALCDTGLRSSDHRQQVDTTNSQRQRKVSMGQLWMVWQAAVTVHQLPSHWHLSLKRGKKKVKLPVTDPPPRDSLTKTSLIEATTSLFFGYWCPFSLLPTCQWVLYPHLPASLVFRASLFLMKDMK